MLSELSERGFCYQIRGGKTHRLYSRYRISWCSSFETHWYGWPNTFRATHYVVCERQTTTMALISVRCSHTGRKYIQALVSQLMAQNIGSIKTEPYIGNNRLLHCPTDVLWAGYDHNHENVVNNMIVNEGCCRQVPRPIAIVCLYRTKLQQIPGTLCRGHTRPRFTHNYEEKKSNCIWDYNTFEWQMFSQWRSAWGVSTYTNKQQNKSATLAEPRIRRSTKVQALRCATQHSAPSDSRIARRVQRYSFTRQTYRIGRL